MKFVTLVDGSKSNFDKMACLTDSKKSLLLDTEKCSENNEYKYLLNTIHTFSQSDKEVMLARFSGREAIVQDLGDESPEMIVSISYNSNSPYYSGCPVSMFSDLINMFSKGE
jgi:hypothetical protein